MKRLFTLIFLRLLLSVDVSSKWNFDEWCSTVISCYSTMPLTTLISSAAIFYGCMKPPIIFLSFFFIFCLFGTRYNEICDFIMGWRQHNVHNFSWRLWNFEIVDAAKHQDEFEQWNCWMFFRHRKFWFSNPFFFGRDTKFFGKKKSCREPITNNPKWWRKIRRGIPHSYLCSFQYMFASSCRLFPLQPNAKWKWISTVCRCEFSYIFYMNNDDSNIGYTKLNTLSHVPIAVGLVLATSFNSVLHVTVYCIFVSFPWHAHRMCRHEHKRQKKNHDTVIRHYIFLVYFFGFFFFSFSCSRCVTKYILPAQLLLWHRKLTKVRRTVQRWMNKLNGKELNFETRVLEFISFSSEIMKSEHHIFAFEIEMKYKMEIPFNNCRFFEILKTKLINWFLDDTLSMTFWNHYRGKHPIAWSFDNSFYIIFFYRVQIQHSK